jgi:glucosamine--fructose-6-phosphate aminotransferase (isomerizing)
MCGIVGYVGSKKVVPVIIEGLRKLEYRGYDSAGIAVVGIGGKLHLQRASGKLRNLEEVLKNSPMTRDENDPASMTLYEKSV